MPGKPERTLNLRERVTNTSFYSLKLKASAKRLVVRAVSSLADVQVTVTLEAEPGSSPPPSTLQATALASAGTAGGTSGAQPPGGSTVAGGSTAVTGPSGADGSAQAPDPYTRLLLNDEFAGPRGAPADSDGADLTPYVGAGSCGAGTLNSDTASDANASLDGEGDLAITALAKGRVPTRTRRRSSRAPSRRRTGAFRRGSSCPPGRDSARRSGS